MTGDAKLRIRAFLAGCLVDEVVVMATTLSTWELMVFEDAVLRMMSSFEAAPADARSGYFFEVDSVTAIEDTFSFDQVDVSLCSEGDFHFEFLRVHASKIAIWN